MASNHDSSIQIPAYSLPVGTGSLPLLHEQTHIDKVREAISNTSDKFIYNYFVSMGESAITMQLRLLARQAGAGSITSNKSWKTIRNTILSEKQLVILSEHYRLREHLLPDHRRRKRWMNTKAYTSRLFLVYVAGYLQSLKPRSPLTWLSCTMVVLVNGMIDECLDRRVQIGIPKLVQELPDSSMGASPTSSQEKSFTTSDAAEANPVEGPSNRPTINQLLEQGWKYSESMVNISGRPFWHVVLFTESIEPISVVRETLDQAKYEATEAAGKLYSKDPT
ncbi:hypothetical protein TWF102_006303 [Orbilia oligospora]|uniref:Uncharacterized protein n=1 Tax=Orbilia oligospora TaxID=2813651 RepID=A0A7C8J9A0_ORBOL|nr:hypothetical protein TWF103_001895 [Orbilia oligospora]KAF3097797.1 hypothetical protein TWF102_006303 [Orbilia oligospora]KAF3104111.1 hypothetical protein TWF706_004583 [Orbilia oligospora]KAF3119435.1 hypothetical protein TWF594_004889 [Orbilia oligospora]KAF3123975.1 hypothetical protein TWF703_000551 [Orbilia oligospora]